MADDTPLVPPDRAPHDPGMEARVQALETVVGQILAEMKAIRQELGDLKSIRQDVAGLKQDVSGIKQEVADLRATNLKIQIDLARIDGRVSQMPTLIQLVTVVIAIWGMAFATLRFAGVN
jgi:regulator of replication initiation timing